MSVAAILICYSVGSAALAAWLVVRFPSLGPTRLSGAILVAAGAWVGMLVAGSLFDLVSGLGGYGVALGLFVVVLPALTSVFWVCACVMRMLAEFRPRG